MLRSQRVTVSNWGRCRGTISTVWSRSSMTKSFGTDASLRFVDPDFVPILRTALRSVEGRGLLPQIQRGERPPPCGPAPVLLKNCLLPGCCEAPPLASAPTASAPWRARPPRREGRRGRAAEPPRRRGQGGPPPGGGPPRAHPPACTSL